MVSTYGASFLTVGKRFRLKTSTGTSPAYFDRSISTTWEKRDRLITTRMVSPSWQRVNARTLGLSDGGNTRSPRLKAMKRLRMAITRFIHHKSDEGLRSWLSTFNAS